MTELEAFEAVFGTEPNSMTHGWAHSIWFAQWQGWRAALAAQQKSSDGIHTCSYYCTRPACIKAQRDELRDKMEAQQKAEPVAWLMHAPDGTKWVTRDYAEMVKAYEDGDCLCSALFTHPPPVAAPDAEILRSELDRAWREVDFIAKERTEHLEWRTQLANELGECELIRDALGRALNKRENDMMLLRNAVEQMMAPLGYHGEISARDDRVQAVMDALAKIDAKEGT